MSRSIGRLLVVPLFVFLCDMAKPMSAADPVTFRVATWNLEWFFDENSNDNFSDLSKQQTAPSRAAWDWKRDAVADAIGKMNADVIGFQEIESGRVLWYLTKAIERQSEQKYRVAFAEGSDTFTEQDVGFLFRNVDVLRTSRYSQSGAMFQSKQYYDLSKHLEIVSVVDPQGAKETVTVIVIHLRATPEAEELRTKQCKLLRFWIDERIKQGENLIVLGDTNSETLAGSLAAANDLGIVCGKATPETADDLVDLHEKLPETNRRTHLLPGKQYDRILVTPGLMEDTPGKPDLVFQDIRVAGELCIRGAGLDEQGQHWDHYWEQADSERDISDHLPVVATFMVR